MMKILNSHKYKTGQGFFTGLVTLTIVIALILALPGGALADSPSITQYTAFPPIGGRLLKPNVLINLDTSTSLSYFAYDFNYNTWTAAIKMGGGPPRPQEPGMITGYNSNKSYYGYLDPGKTYSYNGAEFTEDDNGSWNGNFLNWLTMRRSDIIKMALVGGKTKYRVGIIADPTDTHANDLVGDPPFTNSVYLGYQKQVDNATAKANTSYAGASEPVTFTFDNDEGVRMGGMRRRYWQTSDIPAFSIGSAYNSGNDFKVVVHRDADAEPKGAIQKVGESVRWGLEVIDDGQYTYDPAGSGDQDGWHNGKDETGVTWGGCDMDKWRSATLKDVNGGTIVIPVDYGKTGDMVTAIAEIKALTPATPLAESLWTATGYFSQDSTTGSNGPRYTWDRSSWRGGYWKKNYWSGVSNAYDVSDVADPYNYALDRANDAPRRLPCAKSFVITITDGEPTADWNIPDSNPDLKSYGSTYADDTTNEQSTGIPDWADTTSVTADGTLLNYFWYTGNGGRWGGSKGGLKGSHYIDNVAFYGHADIDSNPESYRDLRTDLITDSDGDGKDDDPQYLTHYFIYTTFGGGAPDARRLMNWPNTGAASPNPASADITAGGAARNGGFIEMSDPENYKPDVQGEYDSDNDGNSDNFYEAEDGYQLEAALINAIYSAFKRASSGTAVSIITNTGDGEGAIYQAYFFPEKFEDDGIRKWLGYINALFVDEYGNLRDDQGIAGKLDETDPVIKMDYSAADGIEIYKCPTNDNGKSYACPGTPAPNGLESIIPIWDGGQWLWDNPAANRSIYTTTDGSTMIDFVDTGNLSDLQPHLRAADNDATYTETKNIINWIRGDDLTGTTDSGRPDGYRQRSLTLTVNGTPVKKVWKLGDIIYSSPTAVGKPMENYDLLYGDSSYTEFRLDKLKRRQMVYTGANDGMLHAFNAGCYDETNRKFDNTACVDGETYDLGQEIWGFIPRGLLPHLKWLTDPDYTHVYYVDLKPKITDVQIFNCNDGVHVGANSDTGKCWGTILIGGFRYGGKKIDWTSGGDPYSASPEYFALDITDPSTPRLLWTFANPVTALNPAGLGLSMSYPAVAKIGNDWYAVFGSGAADYEATSDLTVSQNGNVFVLEMSAGNNGVIKDTDWAEDTNFRKIPTNTPNTFMSDPITVDVDIDYDVDVIYIGGNNDNPNALMYRINTGATMAQWDLTTLGDISIIAGANDVVKRITSAPSAAMDDSANLWVFFGTGQFLGASDKNQTDTGAFYGIKDGCWDGTCGAAAPAFNNLHNSSNIDICVGGGVACGGTKFSVVEADVAAKDGWALYFKNRGENVDFTNAALARNGERVFSKPLVFGGLVSWGSYIPGENECSSDDGENHAYSVYYKTGTAYKEYVFDEQKEPTNDPSKKVARVIIYDNPEPPSSPTGQITSEGTVNIFFPGGASVSGIKDNTPFSIRSDVAGCKSEQMP